MARDKDSSAVDSLEASLLSLIRLIVSRDHDEVVRRLTAAPQLAGGALSAGATRTNSTEYFLTEISHYAYAGDTPLHLAAAAYQPAIADVLLQKGAKAGARNRRGAEPLHYAADGAPGSKCWNPAAQSAVIEILIQSGANPNAADKSGVAPMHRAVRTRCSAAVKTLLLNGADLHQKNGSGSTALHLAVQTTGRGGSGTDAAREEQAAIIRLLLDRGARPTDRDSSGKSVLDCIKTDWIRGLLEKTS
jgi:hypothetical protein